MTVSVINLQKSDSIFNRNFFKKKVTMLTACSSLYAVNNCLASYGIDLEQKKNC